MSQQSPFGADPVEAAAIELWRQVKNDSSDWSWEAMNDTRKQAFRRIALAVLSAAGRLTDTLIILRRCKDYARAERNAMTDPTIAAVARRSYLLEVEVATTEAGYRWRYPDAFMEWSQQVYGSEDEAFDGAVVTAHERHVPVKG